MRKGKLYSIKLYHSKTEYIGIVQSIGKEWVLLYNVFTDFRMDGYLLLKREYIESVTRDDAVKFKEEVLSAKGVTFMLPALHIPLNDTKLLIRWIKENEVTMMLFKQDDNACDVGEVSKILPNSFYLKAIDSEGYWLVREDLYRMKTVRVIEFETDYIKSLLAYNLKKCQEESSLEFQ